MEEDYTKDFSDYYIGSDGKLSREFSPHNIADVVGFVETPFGDAFKLIRK